MAWTSEQEAEAARLWALGGTASNIANRLNADFGTSFSRNAVIGKMHRLALAARKTPARPSAGIKPKAKSAQAAGRLFSQQRGPYSKLTSKPKAPPRVKPKTAEINAKAANFGRGVSLLNIRDNQCRFPLNSPDDRGGLMFCGQLKTESAMLQRKEYCVAHADIATLNESERIRKPRAHSNPRLNF